MKFIIPSESLIGIVFFQDLSRKISGFLDPILENYVFLNPIFTNKSDASGFLILIGPKPERACFPGLRSLTGKPGNDDPALGHSLQVLYI